jgi:hypothetical protein
VTDDHLSSDEAVGENNCEDHLHADVGNAIEEEEFSECQIHDYKKTLIETGIDGVIPISSDRSILYSGGALYKQSRDNVDRIAVRVDHFTYIPKTEEVVFTLKGQNKVFRQSSALGQISVLITLNCEKLFYLGQKDENYITLVLSVKENVFDHNSSRLFKTVTNFYVFEVNDMGCVLAKQKLSSHQCGGKLKLHYSSLVQILLHEIVVYKGQGYSRTNRFSYSGCIGIKPSSIFTPADVCTDSKKNFLVVDSYDNTVHLLDPKGTLLGVIMLAEDGLRGINCVAMDEFGWLWLGCKDGALHFANYQYFKTTTRQERRLMKPN